MQRCDFSSPLSQHFFLSHYPKLQKSQPTKKHFLSALSPPYPLLDLGIIATFVAILIRGVSSGTE